MNNLKSLSFDRSVLLLLVSNIAVIILAVVQKWELSTTLWIYWLQSIIIGFFNFLRILILKNFSVENYKINNQPATNSVSTKLFTAFFFAFHYGFFHFIYAFFLMVLIKEQNIAIMSVGLGGAVFFTDHFFSFLHNKKADEESKPNIGKIMFSPYTRIIPMHLIILLGAGLFLTSQNQLLLIFFLLLKTGVDIISHVRKHDLYRSQT